MESKVRSLQFENILVRRRSEGRKKNGERQTVVGRNGRRLVYLDATGFIDMTMEISRASRNCCLTDILEVDNFSKILRRI